MNVLVHHHLSLVAAIDAFVGNETSSSDHIRGHTIANEQDDILGFTDLLEVANQPTCSGG